MNAKRGYVPEDERNFSASALETMRTASRHIDYVCCLGTITGTPTIISIFADTGPAAP